MSKIPNCFNFTTGKVSWIGESPKYDLEDRTFEFAKNVRLFVKSLPKTIQIIEDSKQVIRSSGSAGANYIEAKESNYWLRLIKDTNQIESKDDADK